MLNLLTQFDFINTSDVLLCFQSLYGLSAWCFLLWGTVSGATRIITTQSFDADFHLSLIEKYKVTYAHNPPHQLALILKSDRLDHTDLSSLRYQSSSGSPVPLHMKREMFARMKNGTFYSRYGMTEASGLMTLGSNISDSVGQLWSFCTVKIIDAHGNRCGVAEDGEICFRSNYKFLKYYGNEAATCASFDDEGFFLTGDIGHFDDDGNLYIVDRKKDIIICKGYHIQPSKIEAFLIESLEIKVVCVVGIRDETTASEWPTAFVVRNPGSNVTGKDIFDSVAGM